MYIRRKVFSIAEDMYGDERYFSTTDIDLGFSDYDDNFYDERLYAEDEGLSTGAKVGLGVAGTAATTAGAIYAAKKGWLGKKAQGWYESGASKLKNMFSKEAKKGAKEVSEENRLIQNFVKTHGTNQRSKFIRRTDNQINKLKDQLALLKKQGKSVTPEYKALSDRISKLEKTRNSFGEIGKLEDARAKAQAGSKGATESNLKDYMEYCRKNGIKPTPEGRLGYSLQMKGERAYSDMYEDDYYDDYMF